MSDDFIVFPAIDLRGGQVVRLSQGDKERITYYDPRPVAAAERWKEAGATWLHVVNLDGAFGDGGTANAAALPELLGTGLKIQYGGGIRSIAAVRLALQTGVARVVIGTAAVETPELVDRALAEFGAERIVIGLDARDGKVKLRGWTAEAAVDAVDLAQQMRQKGVTTIVFTDIARDGLQTGINIEATCQLAVAAGVDVVASGGVKGLDDVRLAAEAGLAGIIVGRALYEGRIRLEDALRVSAGVGRRPA